MEILKRLIYIHCKDCNENIVETPNYYGLCTNCKTDYLNKQKEKKEKNMLIIKSFIHSCDDNRKIELLEHFLYNFNYYPKELEDKLDLSR